MVDEDSDLSTGFKDIAVGMLLLFGLAFFLGVKHGINALSFVLTIFAAVNICQYPEKFIKNRPKEFWILLAVLLTPFFSELCSHGLRLSIVASRLDGDSRFLLAAVLFVFLSAQPIRHLRSFLYFGCVLGILVGVFNCLLFPEYTVAWDGRLATSFIDPITLPVFTSALFGGILFCQGVDRFRLPHQLLVLMLGIITLSVAILSQSRTSWIAIVILVETFLFFKLGKFSKRFFFVQLLLIVLMMLSFSNFELVKDALQRSLSDLNDIRNGTLNSSIGIRLGLFLLDLKLILMSPLTGTPDGVLPPFEAFRDLYPWVNHGTYMTKLLAGSHNEFLARLVRGGVILGTFSLISLFFYPVWFFYTHLKSPLDEVRKTSIVAFGVLIPLLISAMSIQILNLKVTSTFYSFFLAVCFAIILQNKEKVKS